MKIFLQIIKEFWLPFFSALFWALFNTWGQSEASWSIIKFVNIFGATFFLISWITNQYFRIKNQAKTKTDLNNILNTATQLVDELDIKTQDLIGYATGGDSFCYIVVGSLSNESNQGLGTIIHQGKYPLFELSARITDCDVTIKPSINSLLYNNEYHQFGTLISGFCKMQGIWNLEDKPIRRYNIFWVARNGEFTQLLRYMKFDGKWHLATKVIRGDKTIFEKIDDSFPRNNNGNIDW